MRLVPKFLAAAAVFGFLAFAPKASAQFTPPANLGPFLPAANQVSVTKVATIGTSTIWSCSMGGGFALPTSTPMSVVLLTASSNCSWLSFRTASVSSGSLSNGAVVNQAQAYWTANVYNPYYAPLVAAAKASGAKAATSAAAVASPRRR